MIIFLSEKETGLWFNENDPFKQIVIYQIKSLSKDLNCQITVESEDDLVGQLYPETNNGQSTQED